MDVLSDPTPRDIETGSIKGPVKGMQVRFKGAKSEVPVHQHRQGQLVLALNGGVICEVPNSIWMVPPKCAVWVPGQMPHSMRLTSNAQICNLFVQPNAAQMPQECCTLAISPLVRELILHIADQETDYEADSPVGRKAVVLLEELLSSPVEHLHLPTSTEPRMHKMAEMLSENPADRRTLGDWGRELAMSERSLARLVQQETGLSFGRWRQQLHLIVAMHQLASGHPVQRVADHLGYESVAGFISMFKKAYGKPPAKYFSDMAQR